MKANRKALTRCQFGLPAATAEGVEDCGDPAVAVWDKDFYVCEKHDAEMDRLDDEALESTDEEGKGA